MKGLTKKQKLESYDTKVKENDLLNLYLFDREYPQKTPIRAQWASTKAGTIYDAQWYRADSASEGYVIVRYYLLQVNGARGNYEGCPWIISYLELQDRARLELEYSYLLDRLNRSR